jgi:scaffold protein (connect acetoacetyl-CoA thiolase and HMG-CoA synthase)
MPTARVWRERKRRYLNEISVCKGCDRKHYPPRVVCEACGCREMEAARMTETGTVLSYTITHVAPEGLTAISPYAVAILEMDDGTRTMAQIADVDNPDDVEIGMRVRMQFRKVREDGKSGVISYGHKAIPA